MGPCDLLRLIAEKKAANEPTNKAFLTLTGKILKYRDWFRIEGPPITQLGTLTLKQDIGLQLDARIALIQSVLEDGNVQQTIEGVVNATQEAWQHTTHGYIKKFEKELESNSAPNRQPSFLPLSAEDTKITVSRLTEALKAVASVYGWSHPGVLMAGEILAILCGCRREADLTVRSKIMFALPQKGVLAPITIERVPGGCGLLIPDPMRCGYLWMDAEFSSGLQNALWAARNYAEKHFGAITHSFDWRWSIDLNSATRDIPQVNKQVQIQLIGRSPEVVLACAMIAAHQDNPDNQGGIDPLDPHVGATAKIFNPGDSKTDKLAGVGAIDDKTLVDRMESKLILEVLIAKTQTDDCIPPDQRYSFCRADSLADAYHLMTRHPRLTRQVNRYLARRAKKLRDERCTPYVLPEIAELVEQRGDTHSKEPTERTLSKQQIKHLCTGLPIDRQQSSGDQDIVLGQRIFLHGDSGLGKSVFVLFCEQKIANADNLLLPIRLGRCTGEDSSLASINWTIGTDAVIDNLSGLRQITEAFQEIHRDNPRAAVDKATRRGWFRWLVRNGHVVFLLDALDQVEVTVLGLGAFLSRDDLAKCPVIMTGRPEARQGRPQAFQDNQWRILRLKPFDRERQAKYLGKRLADELIPQDGEIDWSSDADEIRKHQWKDLLEIPLLLNLLKELALAKDSEKSLSKIHSRYDLYQLAVENLIQKGWDSAEREEEKRALQSPERVFEVLGKVAWYLVQQHQFTGIVNPDQYQLLASSLGADILKALPQIDLTTAFQVLEQTEKKGLAFRHRSFMEFFAGRYMMDSSLELNKITLQQSIVPRVSEDQREIVLKQIHETIDDQGRFLPHMLGDRADRPGEWNDTLRFPLSHARDNARDQLALRLIELGNPWTVYESVARDGTEYSHAVECLACWLVHRDWSERFDYRNATEKCIECTLTRGESVSEDEVRSVASTVIIANTINLEQMTRRTTRDAAYFSPLRELLSEGQQFYVELSKEQHLLDRISRLSADGKQTWDFRKSFVQVEGGNFDLSEYPEHADVQTQEITIRDFQLADFPVTNELYELFQPSHRRFRDDYSSQPSQPVIWVSQYMATEFCEWLSSLTGEQYRLPTEWEWEWACRWRNTRRTDYWWGKEMRDELCWYSATSDGRTRSRSEAIKALENMASKFRHPSWQSPSQPGLLDILGNVLEWSENWFFGEDWPRVGRGGSWRGFAGGCRSGYRGMYSPGLRSNYLGFRVALAQRPQQAVKKWFFRGI